MGEGQLGNVFVCAMHWPAGALQSFVNCLDIDVPTLSVAGIELS